MVRAKEVQTGSRYVITGKVVVVRVIEAGPGVWIVFNEATKKVMRITSANRFKRVAFGG